MPTILTRIRTRTTLEPTVTYRLTNCFKLGKICNFVDLSFHLLVQLHKATQIKTPTTTTTTEKKYRKTSYLI